jgi:diguanylate cyclase (GGDEF)-like protein
MAKALFSEIDEAASILEDRFGVRQAAGDLRSEPSLVDLLAAAPFGIEVATSDGQAIYANSFSDLTDDGSSLRTRSFAMAVGGQEYVAHLTTDDDAEIKYQQELFRQAYFDTLTGLPNRAVLEKSIAALISDDGPCFAVAVIDLDRFRHVNDYFGRAAGDELLVKVAGRIGSQLGESDLLARISGNAFVLLLSPAESQEEATERLSAIGARIAEPYVIGGQEISTAASIGVSVFPKDGHTCGTLIWNAERAMRGARLDTPGVVRFYDRSLERAVADRNRTEQRLRLAIRDRRVTCAYQPKVDMRTGEVAGVEALMRWRDENGLIQPPGEVLAIAGELGLLDDIAYMVLDETIRSIDRIRDNFGEDSSISLNLAARQAGDERFMIDFIERLEATGFADRLIIEVTEEALLARDTFQRVILPKLRAIGARVSIDDFGIGYSSLSALADITADEVKIDRSFITDVHLRPRSQNVLKAIEALGHSLGMTIVVEGVETIEELDYLRANTRIQLAQGHYFAKAMLLDDVDGPALAGNRTYAVGRPVQSARR